HWLVLALVVVYAAALTPPRFLAAGIALVTGGSQLAAALVIPAAATLVEHVPWRMIYAAIAVLAVAIAVTIRLLLPADEPAPVMAQGTATSPWRSEEHTSELQSRF